MLTNFGIGTLAGAGMRSGAVPVDNLLRQSHTSSGIALAPSAAYKRAYFGAAETVR